MKVWIATVFIGFYASGQVVPPGRTVQQEAPLEGASIVKIVAGLKKAGGIPRGEFETAAEYKTRAALLPADVAGALIFPIISGQDQAETSYNPDQADHAHYHRSAV